MSGHTPSPWTADELRFAGSLWYFTTLNEDEIANLMRANHGRHPFVRPATNPGSFRNLERSYTRHAILSMRLTPGFGDADEFKIPRSINHAQAATIIQLNRSGHTLADITNTLNAQLPTPDFTARAVQDYLDWIASTELGRPTDWARPQTWHFNTISVFLNCYYHHDIDRTTCNTVVTSVTPLLQNAYPGEINNIQPRYVGRAIVCFSKRGLIRETAATAGRRRSDLPRLIVERSPDLRMHYLPNGQPRQILIEDDEYVFR